VQGYSEHIASTSAQWIMVASIMVFILTYVPEFSAVHFTASLLSVQRPPTSGKFMPLIVALSHSVPQQYVWAQIILYGAAESSIANSSFVCQTVGKPYEISVKIQCFNGIAASVYSLAVNSFRAPRSLGI
jgi:hypothetical protein